MLLSFFFIDRFNCQVIIQTGSFSGKLATAKTPCERVYQTTVADAGNGTLTTWKRCRAENRRRHQIGYWPAFYWCYFCIQGVATILQQCKSDSWSTTFWSNYFFYVEKTWETFSQPKGLFIWDLQAFHQTFQIVTWFFFKSGWAHYLHT